MPGTRTNRRGSVLALWTLKMTTPPRGTDVNAREIPPFGVRTTLSMRTSCGVVVARAETETTRPASATAERTSASRTRPSRVGRWRRVAVMSPTIPPRKERKGERATRRRTLPSVFQPPLGERVGVDAVAVRRCLRVALSLDGEHHVLLAVHAVRDRRSAAARVLLRRLPQEVAVPGVVRQQVPVERLDEREPACGRRHAGVAAVAVRHDPLPRNQVR